jgi:hypothetical protein
MIWVKSGTPEDGGLVGEGVEVESGVFVSTGRGVRVGGRGVSVLVGNGVVVGLGMRIAVGDIVAV